MAQIDTDLTAIHRVAELAAELHQVAMEAGLELTVNITVGRPPPMYYLPAGGPWDGEAPDHYMGVGRQSTPGEPTRPDHRIGQDAVAAIFPPAEPEPAPTSPHAGDRNRQVVLDAARELAPCKVSALEQYTPSLSKATVRRQVANLAEAGELVLDTSRGPRSTVVRMPDQRAGGDSAQVARGAERQPLPLDMDRWSGVETERDGEELARKMLDQAGEHDDGEQLGGYARALRAYQEGHRMTPVQLSRKLQISVQQAVDLVDDLERDGKIFKPKGSPFFELTPTEEER